MSDLIFKADTKAFMQAVDRFMSMSKRKREDVMKEQARGILRSVIAITPPGNVAVGRGNSGQIKSDGKKAGEKTLRADLTWIFTRLTQKEIAKELKESGTGGFTQEFAHKGAKALGRFKVKVVPRGEMAAWHKSHRNPGSGRVKRVRRATTTGLKKKDIIGLDIAYVSREDLLSYFNEVKQRIGFLASGWMEAARQLGLKGVPKWITRNSAPGAVKINVSDTGIHIEASNDVRYANKIKDFQRGLNYAIDYQRVAIEKRIKFAEDKEMRRSGLKK